MLSSFLNELQSYRWADFRFTDLRGTWHHLSLPVDQIDEQVLTQGIPFDGSSIDAWKAVHDSDMLLKPDWRKIVADPFSDSPTAVIVCDVYEPVDNTPYSKDPRSIAQKAQAYLTQTQIADAAYFGPEAEFFIFDGVEYQVKPHQSYFRLWSDELQQLEHSDIKHAYRPQHQGGYMPCSPIDRLAHMRTHMSEIMSQMGLVIERQHHEVAAAQHEIGFRFGWLCDAADAMQFYKYTVHQVAAQHGKTATFMPKPLYGQNGSGMHVHQSLWKNNQPLFNGDLYAGLSETALHYIGGILHHARALNAITNPTINSYKRLVPGFEAPVICAYAARNRSAACRIPTSFHPHAKRVEVRFPDPAANPYLAFAALLMAGLDGIINKIDPGSAADENLFENKQAASRYGHVAESLKDALNALANDRAFLKKGGVFADDVIDAFLALKWEEVHRYERVPHPIEYELYY